jgi:hypothetical protein
VLYLGQEVPLVDLRDAFEKDNPDFILTMMTIPQPDMDKQQFVDFLSENWPQSEILLTGPQFVQADLSNRVNVHKVNRFSELIAFVDSMDLGKLKNQSFS